MADNSSSGTSVPMLVFIVFLILKLTGNIDWSWWWVTSPLWIVFAIVAVVFIFALLMNAFNK